MNLDSIEWAKSLLAEIECECASERPNSKSAPDDEVPLLELDRSDMGVTADANEEAPRLAREAA
jgi:hypothetical protein